MNPPNVYHYHPRTGVLTGSGFADDNPLDPGNWLIPAHATTDTPPDVPAGHVAMRLGSEWIVVRDRQSQPGLTKD